MRAARRLCAFSTAEISPVKCRLISSIGITCEYPPPAAPPFIPKTGPREGSLRTTVVFFPIRLRACARPMEVVVFPSPAGVGVIAVTSIRRAFLIFCSSIKCRGILALYLPYNSRSSPGIPIFSAISTIGLILACCAISISCFIFAIFSRKVIYLLLI